MADTSSLSLLETTKSVPLYFNSSRTNSRNQFYIGQDPLHKPNFRTIRPSANAFCHMGLLALTSVTGNVNLPFVLTTPLFDGFWTSQKRLGSSHYVYYDSLKTSLMLLTDLKWNIKPLTHYSNSRLTDAKKVPLTTIFRSFQSSETNLSYHSRQRRTNLSLAYVTMRSISYQQPRSH